MGSLSYYSTAFMSNAAPAMILSALVLLGYALTARARSNPR